MIENLWLGLQAVSSTSVLLAIVAGAIIGYFIGAMPGLTPTIGVALMVPFTFGMDPLVSLSLLGSLYAAAEYGGGITAILLNTPGTPSAAATAFDGYPLARRGQVGRALGISIVSSGIAQFVGTLLLIAFTLPLAKFALTFGPPEYLALAVFGLTVVAGLAGSSWIKALIMVAAGLLITTIGTDPVTGHGRFIFTYDLMDGIPLVPALLGLFAISEVMLMLEERANAAQIQHQTVSGSLPSKADMLRIKITMVRSSLIGFIIGVIPGAGATIASFIAYGQEKRASKHPEEFGNGSIEGLAAAEAANNSAVSGAMVPLLTLGIPGSATAAIMLGALTIQGLQPGPFLFVNNPEVVYGFFWAFLIGVPIMVAMGIMGIQFWYRAVQVPKPILISTVLGICLLGAYSLSNSLYPVWVAVIFGVIGYLLRKADYPPAPMVLAIVLGDLLESSFRRSLMMGDGSLSIFFTRPITVGILLISCLVLLAPAWRCYRSRKGAAAAGANTN